MSTRPSVTTNKKPLPAAPIKGMQVWVQTGSHWCVGTAYTISEVNSRSFYVSSGGGRRRLLLSRWDRWVRERLAEGLVSVDGVAVGGTAPSAAPPVPVAALDFEVSLPAREARFLRAARQVLGTYRFQTLDEDPSRPTLMRVAVSGGSRAYEVGLWRDWSGPPSCTCPDASNGARWGTAGFCKHAIAVCLRTDEVRCQLLDLLI